MNPTPKLIVVSNRLPFVLKEAGGGKLKRVPSVGGLVTAVAPIMISGKGSWVGYAGESYEEGMDIPESDPEDKTPLAGVRSKQVEPVIIPKEIYSDYYNGACNATFWPLFHSLPDRSRFVHQEWLAYTEVNKLFAEKVMAALKKDYLQETEDREAPLVWLHDYHVMLAANAIRLFGEQVSFPFHLGFFLHIPFPSWDVFRLFPWADDVLQGLLGNDMVGFHTDNYCLNFIECCYRCLGCRVDRNLMLVEHGGRTVRVRALPIGIPYQKFYQMALVAPPADFPKDLQIILGVDRLDYTKGILHRLKAVDILFTKYPEHIGKVAVFQIVVPSRVHVQEYKDLKEEIDLLVGRLNGKYSTTSWFPIRYMYDSVTQEKLAGIYRDASVAFITPLRDGMNLVAKEYVACQTKDPPGVLIVSPFAGAGEMMHEALICNPYEVEDCAKTLHRALTMPADERTLRMNYLKKREKAYDVDHWLKTYLQSLLQTKFIDGTVDKNIIQPVTLDDYDKYLGHFTRDKKKKLVLLLDYDGTLSPIAPHPDLATLPAETRSVLQRLSNNPNVHISIVSGRDVYNVRELVGIENITYAGSHGLKIVHPDGNYFVYPMPMELEEKARELSKDLQEYVCKEGAWVENKGVYLTYHYRNVPMDLRPELLSKAKDLIEQYGFIVVYAHAALESKPRIEWDKGRASIYILRTAFGLDWSERINIIYVGDDQTDEDAMEALKGMAVTFRVTQSTIVKTAANHRLPSPDSVLTLLKWVDRTYSSDNLKKELKKG